MARPMIVHAKAPVRLDWAGGWTDVAPFATEERGVVVNSAIALYVEARLELGGDGYHLESRELGQTLTARRAEELEKDGRLDLLKAAVRLYQLGPCHLSTRSDAPAGSGLGSSGALGVALVAACERAVGRHPPPTEIAERAWELEAVEAGLPGGKQDQYAAALGGWHRLEFSAGVTRVAPLALPAGFAARLGGRLILGYTGQSRVSSATIARVMTRYVRGTDAVADTLRELTRVAEGMADALEAGDPGGVALLLSANWRLQRRLDDEMATPLMNDLTATLAEAGAIGGKAAGAGAGGSMFFLLDRDPAVAIRAARGLGVTVLPVEWAATGVQVW